MKIPAREVAELVKRASSGESLEELAAAFHVSAQTARMYCYRAGLTPRRMRAARARRQLEAAGAAVV